MRSTSQKVARSTTRRPNEDADPVGFGTTLTEIIADVKDAYRARLHAFLRVFLLVRLAPAVRRSIFAAVTARGRPVSFDFRITFYPPDASGFYRAVGALKTPFPDLSDQPDAPGDGPYIDTLFGERVPASLLNTKRRRVGRRR